MIRSIIKLVLAGGILGATVSPGGPRQQSPATGPAISTVVAATREHRLPAIVPSVRIEGEIAGVAGTGLLTVRMAGVVIAQQAATGGVFAVDVHGMRRNGMVTLEYAQPGVRFNSNLGSYMQVARLAGSDATLTLDECACVRISPFSTALQLVVSRELGHAPTSDVQFDNSVRVVGNDLATATVALARFAEDPTQLPDTHDSGLALLEDHPAFVQFLQDTNFLIMQGDYAETLDALPAAATVLADVPARFALINPLLNVRAPNPTGASVIERSASIFTVHQGSLDSDLTYTGQLDGSGTLTLEPDREVVSITPPVFDCPETGEQVAERSELLRRSYRRHWTSGPVEIWQSTTEVLTTLPDCPMPQPGSYRLSGFVVVADLASTRQLTTARRFQTVALPTFCDTNTDLYGVHLVSCEYAIHTFARNGLGEVSELGMKLDADLQPVAAQGRAPFSWSMGPDGAMHVQSGAVRTRYWILDGGDGVALGALYVADVDRDIGNVSISGYIPMIRMHEADVFASVSPLGAWRLATVEAVNRGSLEYSTPGISRTVRDEAGISSQWSDNAVTRRDTWTMSNGRLYTTTWRGSGCVPPAAGCTPSIVRYFRPLARAGNRVHGIEDLYYNNGSGNKYIDPVTRGDSRPQWQLATDMPTAPSRPVAMRAAVTAAAGRP